jgi:hypothetical protein
VLLLQVAVGIVSHCEAALLKLDDMEDIVLYLRQTVPQWSKPALHDMLTDCLRCDGWLWDLNGDDYGPCNVGKELRLNSLWAKLFFAVVA